MIRLFRFVFLALAISFVSGCGSGAYFLDDGLRLAHDSKTGEYIGERVSERKARDKETGKDVVFYKIKRKDGSIDELSADKVKLSKP